MTAARLLLTGHPLDRLAQRSAPSASAGAGEVAPGVIRLAAPASDKTPPAVACIGEAGVPGNDVGGGRDELDADPVEYDVFAEPARLAWLGILICWLTATSTGAVIVWALVG